LEQRAPKYYNSTDTVLFKKSECLYGLDMARQAGTSAGYLAVVEGYTDVLMAHQMGVAQVVATMGTALNARHVQQLRAFVPHVVLVFDADVGGDTGADRALQIFAGQNVELAVATLPEGMDPCDLLVQKGPEPFLAALTNAVDALEFKLNQVLSHETASSVEGQRRAVDAILGILAIAPEMPGQDGAIKRDLMLSRISQRFALQEETVRRRMQELRSQRASDYRPVRVDPSENTKQKGPAPKREMYLTQLLLAEPALVPDAAAEVSLDMITHPGLRTVIGELYALHAAGEPCTVNMLRLRIPNTELMDRMVEQQEIGRQIAERPLRLRQLLDEFQRIHRIEPEKQELHNQLHAAGDHDQALELLRQLQNQRVGSEP
jgi:DNA primase